MTHLVISVTFQILLIKYRFSLRLQEGSRFWSTIKMVKESCDVHSE